MTDELIYGRSYKLWRDGEFIGEATWTDDKKIGDAFIKIIIDKDHGAVSQIFEADRWELIE